MLGIKRRNYGEVIDLFDNNVEVESDAKIIDLRPTFKERATNVKYRNFWKKLDVIGSLFEAVTGQSSQDTGTKSNGDTIDYVRRRGLAFGFIASISAFGIGVVGINEIGSGQQQTDNQYLESPTVDGFEATGDRITQIDSFTFYEEAGNVLCRFSGIETVEATTGSTQSQIISVTEGTNFSLDVGTDCYGSALAISEQLNPQGFVISVHDPDTYDSSIPNQLNFPTNVERKQL
ncbi:hypothetical protein KDA00_04290 [Candidatus Saccharibacteria bacterium]|nr:hypothetical protein [Candidatus Saccharibacteria bacterium]